MKNKEDLDYINKIMIGAVKEGFVIPHCSCGKIINLNKLEFKLSDKGKECVEELARGKGIDPKTLLNMSFEEYIKTLGL